jgi:DNA-binding NtrC family response regulator
VSTRILLVDDDRAFRVTAGALLENEGHSVTGAESADEAVRVLGAGRFDLLLLDLRMPGVDGISLLEVLRSRGVDTPVLMISGFGTVDAAVRALKSGADDFLTKPIEPELLIARVQQLLAVRPTPGDDDEASLPGLVGRSPAMLEVFRAIRQVAPTEATVLVTGETGTGKELVARAIHAMSPRRARPFVAVNCAALAEGVLESELFGHVRGAFTGAVSDRVGLFRSADGGTLFLDEIGDVSPAVQRRLLRVLQEREIVPVGSSTPRQVDVRIVAATHHDLGAEVRAGRFRDDLLYRVDVFRIPLPPLRERPGDVPLLVHHFLGAVGRARGGGAAGCAPLSLRMLESYEWPGNVRELVTALESALIRASEGPIEPAHLREEIRASVAVASRFTSREGPDVEALRIRTALEQAGGVRSRAAHLLGMGRTTLWRKMRHHGIDGGSGGHDGEPEGPDAEAAPDLSDSAGDVARAADAPP